jgi:hypothetical protein
MEQFRQKTINGVCVVWSPKHDGSIVSELGSDDSVDADWPLPSSPPIGDPLSGFNIRSQSRPEEGFIYVDFDNVPYFWRHDVNPAAIPWSEQYDLVLQALRAVGLDEEEVNAFLEARQRPRDIKMPLSLLKRFATEFGNLLKSR